MNIEKANILKFHCKFCNIKFTSGNIKKHQKSCKNNPDNLKKCPICNRDFYTKGTTCSRSCANTFFRSGDKHPNWKESAYRTTCFLYHIKKCIICKERNIVEVHHLDENKDNNVPLNLIPLCPTHHQYWHSKFRYLIKQKIDEYIENKLLSTD